LLLLLPFILMGALVPSPAYRQYFYPLVPFGLAAVIYGLASLPKAGLPWKMAYGGVLACAAISLLWNARHYDYVQDLLTPRDWVPMKVHHRALTLRESVPAGTILTLAPTHPLEAGLDIDPSFATGPFAWRISAFVDPAKAQRLDLVTLPTLEAHLAAHPPSGILVGIGDKLVGPFVDYAQQHGADSVRFRKDQDLWILPPATTSRESLD
ncbi:MAG: hypothetical protein U0984_10065, partial [Prosthecobacter sp.]|nr:hypothetical protein [Prosthecobacter sp.]